MKKLGFTANEVCSRVIPLPPGLSWTRHNRKPWRGTVVGCLPRVSLW
jgi:hypothetical protein